MRALTILILSLAAGCSEGGGEAPKAKEKAAAATALHPGQWETATEVVRLKEMDGGAPRIATPAGTKATASTCVAAADAKRPPPALFTASKDACEYRDIYMSRGRLSAELTCRRPGLNGDILVGINASFTATSFEGTTDTATQLATDGDVRIQTKLTGRRVGDCTPA